MFTTLILGFLLLAGAFAVAIVMALRSAAARPWRFELGAVVGDAFRAIGRAPMLFVAAVLLTSAAPFAVPILFLGMTGTDFGSDTDLLFALLPLAGLFWLTAGQFGYMLMVSATLDALATGEVSVRRSLGRAARALPAGVAILVLFWIAVAIGLSLFVIPGMILMSLWFVVTPALIAERTGVFGSFARSFRLTAGARWQLVLLLVIGAIFWMVMYLLIGVVAAILGAPIGSAIVSALLFALLGMIPPAVVGSVYHTLRTQKEGMRGDDLEQVFA